MTTRVSKEPERPRRFPRQSGWGDRNRQLPGPRWDAHDRGEQTTGDTVVSAREEFERVETDGGESERPIVSWKRGNYPEGRFGVGSFFPAKKRTDTDNPPERDKRDVSVETAALDALVQAKKELKQKQRSPAPLP